MLIAGCPHCDSDTALWLFRALFRLFRHWIWGAEAATAGARMAPSDCVSEEEPRCAFASIEPLFADVLSNLSLRDIASCVAASRSMRAAAATPLLWQRVYCARYRSDATEPTSNPTKQPPALPEPEPATLDVDAFDWIPLLRRRLEALGSYQVRCNGPSVIEARPTGGRELCLVHAGRASPAAWGGSQQCAVLAPGLNEAPLPLARPISSVRSRPFRTDTPPPPAYHRTVR